MQKFHQPFLKYLQVISSIEHFFLSESVEQYRRKLERKGVQTGDKIAQLESLVRSLHEMISMMQPDAKDENEVANIERYVTE